MIFHGCVFFENVLSPKGWQENSPKCWKSPNVWILSIAEWFYPFPHSKSMQKNKIDAVRHVPDLLWRAFWIEVVRENDNKTCSLHGMSWGPCMSFSCQILGRNWYEYDDCGAKFCRNTIPKWSNMDPLWPNTHLGGAKRRRGVYLLT